MQRAGLLVNNLQGKVAALVGAFAAIGAINWLGGMAAQLDVFDDLSAQTKISTEALQLWGFAAGQNGSSAQEMNRSLELLQKAMGQLEGEGKLQADALRTLGIEARDSAGNTRPLAQLLEEMPAAFAGLSSDAEKAFAATTLFGRSGARLVPLLEQGEEGMARLRAEFERLGGGATPEAIKAAGEYRDAVAKMDLAMFGLKSRMAGAVFPALQKVIDATAGAVAVFSKWADSTTLASSGVYAIAAAITAVLLPAILPLLPALLLFAAAFLVFDDVKAFFEGNDSLVGRALEKWFGKENADKVRRFFTDAIGDFKWFLARFGEGSEEMKASWADDWDIMVEGIRTGDMIDKWLEWITASADEADSWVVDITADFVALLAVIFGFIAGLIYDFTHGFEKIRALNFEMTTGIKIAWQEMVIALSNMWNGFVDSINVAGIFDGLKADTGDNQAKLGTLRTAVAEHAKRQEFTMPNNAIGGQQFQVPTSIVTTVGEVTVIANPGERVDAAAARGVGKSIANKQRSVAQALVPRAAR